MKESEKWILKGGCNFYYTKLRDEWMRKNMHFAMLIWNKYRTVKTILRSYKHIKIAKLSFEKTKMRGAHEEK